VVLSATTTAHVADPGEGPDVGLPHAAETEEGDTDAVRVLDLEWTHPITSAWSVVDRSSVHVMKRRGGAGQLPRDALRDTLGRQPVAVEEEGVRGRLAPRVLDADAHEPAGLALSDLGYEAAQATDDRCSSTRDEVDGRAAAAIAAASLV
jgi:hypothetical protein